MVGNCCIVLAAGRKLYDTRVEVKCQQAYFTRCKNNLHWPPSNYSEDFYKPYVCVSDSSCNRGRVWDNVYQTGDLGADLQ